jgi:hypothetical protein
VSQEPSGIGTERWCFPGPELGLDHFPGKQFGAESFDGRLECLQRADALHAKRVIIGRSATFRKLPVPVRASLTDIGVLPLCLENGEGDLPKLTSCSWTMVP